MNERGYFLPKWYKELLLEAENRTCHFIILSYNVYDYVFPEVPDGGSATEFKSVKEFLQRDMMNYAAFDGILFFSETSGFSVIDSKSFELFSSIIGKDRLAKSGVIGLKECQGTQKRIETRESLDLINRLLNQREEKIAIVLEFLENLAPSGAKEHIHEEKMVNVEILRRIAMDENIEKTKNIVIGITDNIGGVDVELRRESRCKVIDIPLPLKEERFRYLEYLASMEDNERRRLPMISDSLGADQTEKLENFAEHTHGFNFRALDEFVRKENLNGYIAEISGNGYEGVTLQKIQKRRRSIIQNESKELLIEIPPRGDFNSVGNLAHIKDYLKQVIKNIKLKKTASTPKGILLAGPPGTGKTIIAEALAQEAEINIVQMGDIKSKWVGESEKNLEKVFRLLKDMAPVIVFVDEIDQAIGGRVTEAGSGGGERVSAAMFAKILQEMGSNENRGEILWICATNRPEVLDAAMLRRFDRIFPVLLPYSKESRVEIFKAMEKGIVDNFKYDENVDFESLAEKIKGYSGSEIEQIVRDAVYLQECRDDARYDDDKNILLIQVVIEKAIENFKTNRDDTMYLYQTLLALKFCRSVEDLPHEEDVPDELREVISYTREKRSNDLINKRLEEVKRDLASRKAMGL